MWFVQDDQFGTPEETAEQKAKKAAENAEHWRKKHAAMEKQVKELTEQMAAVQNAVSPAEDTPDAS